MLNLQESSGHFRGIKISRTAPPISHLLYADDLIVFCIAIDTDANHIKACLDKFALWSSQFPNPNKSFVHFSANATYHTKNSILNILNFPECSHNEKHLGLPFCIPKSKISAFNDLVSKIKSKLSSWKAKTISQVGKTILITAVASALPSYSMSTFLIPKSICSKIDACFRKFWWGKIKMETLSCLNVGTLFVFLSLLVVLVSEEPLILTKL